MSKEGHFNLKGFSVKPAVVLLGGLALASCEANLSLGLSFRVPFTSSNATIAGSLGNKELANATLPDYVQKKVGENDNFINSSASLTLWQAEGKSVFICKQPGAPVLDLHVRGRTK